VAGADGEADWTALPETDDSNASIAAPTEPVACTMLGGGGFQPLTESPWETTVVAGGDLAETVDKLEARPGGDMITHEGGTLLSDLIAQGLLDELHLLVNPTATGAGMPVFPTSAPTSSFASSRRAVRLRDHRVALGIQALRSSHTTRASRTPSLHPRLPAALHGVVEMRAWS
jgi:RibD domain-containing protein